MKDRTRIEEE